MPGSRVVIDGLWRCLCPSFDSITLRAVEQPVLLKRPLHQARSSSGRCLAQHAPSRQVRRFHSTPPRHDYYDLPAVKVRKCAEPLKEDFLLQAKPPYRELITLPVSDIHQALRQLQHREGAHRQIKAFVQHLLEVRGEKPSALIYEVLLRANASVEGSADEVRELLQEMRSNGVEGSAGLYHAALQALAVHPDYLMRNTVIREMRDRWIEITPEGWHHVVVGLLRDGQYELALDKLEDLAKASVEIPGWLYDIFIYTFGQLGFFDEALKIMNHRLQKELGDVSLNVWHFLLETCSGGYHYEGTKYVWNRMVQPKHLAPSDGTTLNVLNTAARHGDAKLADQAIQYMSSRGTKLGVHHFEALLDCYAGVNDIEHALHGLCIMAQAGISVDQGSTRSIFRSLRRSPSLVDAAVRTLIDLPVKHRVPIAAFNVVVEAMLANGDRTGEALDLYRHVRQVCRAGPDMATFRVLLQRCDGDARLVGFFASEMAAFGLEPDAEIYDAFVRIAVRHGPDLDLAMKYVMELIEKNVTSNGSGAASMWIGEQTAQSLVKRCVRDEDPRLWDMLEACRARGMDLDWVVQEEKQKEVDESPLAEHKKENWPGEMHSGRSRSTGLEEEHEPLHV